VSPANAPLALTPWLLLPTLLPRVARPAGGSAGFGKVSSHPSGMLRVSAVCSNLPDVHVRRVVPTLPWWEKLKTPRTDFLRCLGRCWRTRPAARRLARHTRRYRSGGSGARRVCGSEPCGPWQALPYTDGFPKDPRAGWCSHDWKRRLPVHRKLFSSWDCSLLGAHLHFSSVFHLAGKESQAKTLRLNDVFGGGHLLNFPPE